MWRVQCLEELRSGAAAIVFREAYALRHYIISPVRDTSPLIPPYLLSSSLSPSQALPWALLPDLPLPLALLLSPLVPPPAGVIPPTSLTQR